MSFQEKSTWVSLAVNSGIFGFYFYHAFAVLGNPEALDRGLIVLFVGLVILTIIVQTVSHILLSLMYRKDEQAGIDERDKLIELKANRVSYIILAGGVWLTFFGLMVLPIQIVLANILMAFFIISEVVGYGVQLYYYRRGI